MILTQNAGKLAVVATTCEGELMLSDEEMDISCKQFTQKHGHDSIESGLPFIHYMVDY
jgi:hypothetical protein